MRMLLFSLKLIKNENVNFFPYLLIVIFPCLSPNKSSLSLYCTSQSLELLLLLLEITAEIDCNSENKHNYCLNICSKCNCEKQ